MNDKTRMEELMDGWLAGTLRKEEVEAFLSLIEGEEDYIKSVINQWLEEESFTGLAKQERETVLFEGVMKRALRKVQEDDLEADHKIVPFRRRNWRRYIAAAVLLAIAATTFLLVSRRDGARVTQQAGLEQRYKNDVPAGGDRAILTLADGRQILLDSVSGNIAREGGVMVMNQAGQLRYNPAKNVQPSTINYNTVHTPGGGQYQLVLADGTKVWLNAVSSLRFPTAFRGRERVVELTGEAYFEVAHNPEKPFRVKVNNMDVQVLGTHFNIMAYENEEAIKTTLLEGKVKVQTVAGTPQTTILQPGAQAQLTKGNVLKNIPDANIDQAVAWKNGVFDCNGLDIAAIMRQVARWYDVKVEMGPSITQDKFVGRIPKTLTLVNLLKVLELNGVKFTVEGKRITVR